MDSLIVACERWLVDSHAYREQLPVGTTEYDVWDIEMVDDRIVHINESQNYDA
jgi:hypothetical protein